MKFSFLNALPFVRRRNQRAMTIAEMMISMTVFGMMTMGLAYITMFVAKVDQLTQSKLGASDMARRGFSKFANDVRSAKIWYIGNGGVSSNSILTNFVGSQLGSTNFIQGNAMKISLTTDTNYYIYYYFETNRGRLLRLHSGTTNYSIIAAYLTNGALGNTMYFNNQSYSGQTTNVTQNHKSVVAVLLQFSQYQYPLTHVGEGFYYDYYRLSFKLTPHVPDGP